MARISLERTPALVFFGEAISSATTGPLTSEQVQRMLEDLFVAAEQDPNVDFIAVIRQGNEIAVLGTIEGEIQEDVNKIARILDRVIHSL